MKRKNCRKITAKTVCWHHWFSRAVFYISFVYLFEMELERSRNGYYTLTFINNRNLREDRILEDFSSVGDVCGISFMKKRVFIRYKNEEEAQLALAQFKKSYRVSMAINNGKYTDDQESDNSPTQPIPPVQNKSTDSSLGSSMIKDRSNYHLILANLPKSYTVSDIEPLVQEVKPLVINEIEETIGFHVKFCHIVLTSAEHLSYLINKLHEFVICGEKLIAVEAKNLLRWREKVLKL